MVSFAAIPMLTTLTIQRHVCDLRGAKIVADRLIMKQLGRKNDEGHGDTLRRALNVINAAATIRGDGGGVSAQEERCGGKSLTHETA